MSGVAESVAATLALDYATAMSAMLLFADSAPLDRWQQRLAWTFIASRSGARDETEYFGETP